MEKTRTVSGERVKALREKLGWSQGEMAEHLNVSNYATILRWENGYNPANGPVALLIELFEKAAKKGGTVRIQPVAEAVEGRN